MSSLTRLFFCEDTTGDWFLDGTDLTQETNYVATNYSGNLTTTESATEDQVGATVKIKMVLTAAKTISTPFFVYIAEEYDYVDVCLTLYSGTTAVLSKCFRVVTTATSKNRVFLVNNATSITFDSVELSFTTRAVDQTLRLGLTSAKTSDVDHWEIDTGSGYVASTNIYLMRIQTLSGWILLDKDEYSSDSFLMLDDDIANTAGYMYIVPVEIDTPAGAVYVAVSDLQAENLQNQVSDSFSATFENAGILATQPDTSTKAVLIALTKTTATGNFRILYHEDVDLTNILLDGIDETMQYQESKTYTDDRYVFKYLRSNWLEWKLTLGYLTSTEYSDLRTKLDGAKQGDTNLAIDWNNKIYFTEIADSLTFNWKKSLYRINLSLEEKKI